MRRVEVHKLMSSMNWTLDRVMISQLIVSRRQRMQLFFLSSEGPPSTNNAHQPANRSSKPRSAHFPRRQNFRDSWASDPDPRESGTVCQGEKESRERQRTFISRWADGGKSKGENAPWKGGQREGKRESRSIYPGFISSFFFLSCGPITIGVFLFLVSVSLRNRNVRERSWAGSKRYGKERDKKDILSLFMDLHDDDDDAVLCGRERERERERKEREKEKEREWERERERKRNERKRREVFNDVKTGKIVTENSIEQEKWRARICRGREKKLEREN